MPAERLSMRHLREMLRLRHSSGLSQYAIARSLGLAQGTVSKYLWRARQAGLSWPSAGQNSMMTIGSRRGSSRRRPICRRTSVLNPTGPRCIANCAAPMSRWRSSGRSTRHASRTASATRGSAISTREWAGRLKPTLRQVHVAGEKLFVDYAGRTMEVIDGATGEARAAQIFVAVLGASSYTYAEATFTQSLPDWIGSHARALAFIGGAARQTVSDNLRSGVTRACFHEPLVNRTYADLARHYGTAIVPARPYKPRDKAKVEVGVQIVGRWVLARLRHRRFFSLAGLNAAIRELLADLNDRTMRGFGQSRRALFEGLERAALVPVPDEPFAYAEWKRIAASGSITTSRSAAIITASPPPWSARRSRPG